MSMISQLVGYFMSVRCEKWRNFPTLIIFSGFNLVRIPREAIVAI